MKNIGKPRVLGRRTDGASLKIESYSGPIIYSADASEQIEKGRLCELDIQYHVYDHKLYNDNDSDLNYAETYAACIVNNEGRNKFVVEKTLEMLDEDRQVLVLIQIIDHGHILKEMFMQGGMDESNIRFIWGDTPNKIRQQAISDFRQGKFKVLIGSTIADTGLDIRTVSGVVLCQSGNSDITLIQRIGRGARNCDYEKEWGYIPEFIKKANGKKITRVVDILDTNVAFFKKQSKNRYSNACAEFGADRVHIVGADKSIFRHRSRKKQDLNSVDDMAAMQEAFAAFGDVCGEGNSNQISKDSNVDNFLSLFGK